MRGGVIADFRPESRQAASQGVCFAHASGGYLPGRQIPRLEAGSEPGEGAGAFGPLVACLIGKLGENRTDFEVKRGKSAPTLQSHLLTQQKESEKQKKGSRE